MKSTPFRVTVKDFSALPLGEIRINHASSTAPHAACPQAVPESSAGGNLRPDRPAPPDSVVASGRKTSWELAPVPTAAKPARVLIADDSPNVRESLAKLLQAEGYEVELAANGQEALEKFDPQTTNLVLLDLDMPVTNGWEALQQLMRINPDQAIIVITGQPEPCRWTGAGGGGILVEKPINVTMLLDAIQHALNETKSKRQERIAIQHTLARHTQPLPSSLRWHGFRRGGLNE